MQAFLSHLFLAYQLKRKKIFNLLPSSFNKKIMLWLYFFPTTTVLTAALTFLVTTTTSASSQAVTTGEPLTTSAHDSVTSQSVTPRSVTNPPLVGVEIPQSPIDDPRVGWIHELKKARLIEVMRLNNLDTERKSTELRKRFCEYWKD